MINYFTLLRLPEQYDLDMQLLEDNLLQLQQQHHPDCVIDKTAAVQQKAHQQTALINLAYEILQSPMQRAAHLLELAGYDLENTPVDLEPAFLQNVMQWRFALADMDDAQTINELFAEVKTEEQQQLHELGVALRKKLPSEAITLYTKLKFLQRFKQELIAKLDSYDEVI